MSTDAAKIQHPAQVRKQGPPVPGDLADRLSDLARTLQHEDNSESILAGIVHAALELIPHVRHASVSLVEGHRKIDSRAASGDLPRQVDALQSKTGQGPCLDAAYEERVVRVQNMQSEERWPDFARGAYELGARSMLSIQLFVQGDTLGALNLYGDGVDVFDDESEQVGLLVGAHAAVAFAGSEQISQLNDALLTRDLIGQAKGILMERFKITAQQAFLLLSRVSSDSNVKLRDVAEHLTTSGEITTHGTT
jgi:GAF domain-containing protein